MVVALKLRVYYQVDPTFSYPWLHLASPMATKIISFAGHARLIITKGSNKNPLRKIEECQYIPTQ
jgi:hypothetical protein